MSFVTAVGPGPGSHGSQITELSPNEFAADLDRLATQLLGNQLYAQLVLRQPDLRILSDPVGLGRAALTAQARNARAARHFLGTIRPRMAALLGEATSLGDLMQGLNRTLSQTDDPQTAAEALSRVVERMREHEADTRDGLALARTHADIADSTARMLDKAIDQVFADLGGQPPRIARARAAVERTQKTISDAVQAILCDDDISGTGIRDIATRSMPLSGGISGASSPDCGAIAEFHVETVTSIAPDMPGQAQIPQAIRDSNALLRRQYGALATFSAMLAAAQAIRSQTVELGNAACRLARILGEADATLATICTSIESLRTRLNKGEAVPVIAAELDMAMFAWTRLTIRTREIRQTLSGMNLLFPGT